MDASEKGSPGPAASEAMNLHQSAPRKVVPLDDAWEATEDNLALGRWEEAEDAYKEAVDADPESCPLWVRLAAVRCRQGGSPEADLLRAMIQVLEDKGLLDRDDLQSALEQREP